ncbi:MAG: PAS domain-containing protein [Deferribacteraceae bacterium]|jgi:PAS domain S-box-containing protein|nr:PAS domain-containing protein [Deferribacteraceae bacterium]
MPNSQLLVISIAIALIIFALLATQLVNGKKKMLKNAYNALEIIFSKGNAVCYIALAETPNRCDFITPNCKALLGYSSSLFTKSKMPFFNMVHPDDIRNATLNNNFSETHNSKILEYRYKKPDGEYIWLEEHRFMIYSGGKPFAIVGMLTDATEEVKHKKAMEKSTFYFHTIFENSSIPSIIADKSCSFILVNQAAYSLFETDNVTKEPSMYFDAVALDKLYKTLQNDYSTVGTIYKIDSEIVTAKQNKKAVCLHVSRIHNDDRQFSIQIIDLSESKGEIVALTERLEEYQQVRETEERIIKQSSKMAEMGSLLDMIIHQWKQPLSSLYATTELLKEEVYDPVAYRQEIHENFAFITNQLEFMSTTAETFRTFFKDDSELAPYNMAKAIENVIFMLSGIFRQSNIEVSLDVLTAEENMILTGNVNEMQQVILNILLNAKDAILEKRVNTKNPVMQGSIKVTIKYDNALIVTAMDNGVGIAESMQDAIFTAYKTTKKDGTGIGLYTSKLIIEKYADSYMMAENHYDGAIFTLHIGSNKVI